MPHVVLLILDGVGVGALPDAERYGDAGSDTLGHTAEAVGGLDVPVLGLLGLGNIHKIAGVPPTPRPGAAYGRMGEVSAGKDSTTGHWELLGIVTSQPFPTYPQGFPNEVIGNFRAATGYDVLGNEPASGTEIIQRLGDEHVQTGKLIVYTSADSVFQIAAHEDVVPLAELYRVCQATRKILIPPHCVSRVIARPFVGSSGHYERTPNRRDYSVVPPAGLLLPILAEQGIEVISIGKVYDLYAGQGITARHEAKGNEQGMATLTELYGASEGVAATMFMLNLVDFDMLWGHRNDPAGMAAGLVLFDRWLGRFLDGMRADDLLLITADHGNDPTTPSTDHSREYVPVLARFGRGSSGTNLGTRDSFADVGATIAEFFGLPPRRAGRSFLAEIEDGREKGGESCVQSTTI